MPGVPLGLHPNLTLNHGWQLFTLFVYFENHFKYSVIFLVNNIFEEFVNHTIVFCSR